MPVCMHLKVLLVLVLSGSTLLQGSPILRRNTVFFPVKAEQGMVAAAEQQAAQVGLDILREGGNAIDAAVATGFALAVTLPRAGNIGGGGFMLIHEAQSGETFALDYRETAPAAAHRDMFLNDAGEADPELSRYSAKAVGVPGTVAGLLEAHKRFGTLPLYRLVSPAIKLAEEGFLVSSGLSDSLRQAALGQRFNAAAQAVYFDAQGDAPSPGTRLRQEDLAETLKRIRDLGRSGFYQGLTAARIVDTLRAGGSEISMTDFKEYQPVWREPVKGQYKDHTIFSMPPPSSGGIHLVQMLQVLEHFPLAEWGHNSAKSVHHMAEVMKRAYADRSEYLGDPDFINVPQTQILSAGYTDLIASLINPDVPTPSQAIAPGDLPPEESPQTTHFSIVDGQGNAVSNTYTLNFSYGSGIMAEGTGVLLNNEMDDFSAKPGTPNAYGLIGGEANAVEPRKRMLSSMTPTLVLKDDQVHLVTGSPGGSRIINTVLQIVLNVIEFDMNIAEATNAPRFHHQWLPDTLFLERGFPTDTKNLLLQKGYSMEIGNTIGSAQSIIRMPEGSLFGAADPRRADGAVLGF